MEAEFWRARWTERDLGFHQAKANPLLVEYWPALGVAKDARVFVPLSGKSLDLRWLRERGHGVLGVELSSIAVGEFFDEATLEPTKRRMGPFEVWEAGGFRVLEGDFFALEKKDLDGVRAVYDRAALVALPPDMRRAYARALTERLPANVSILLIAMEAQPLTPAGPPFSVVESEVHELFDGAFDVQMLHRTPFEVAPGGSGAARASVVYVMRR